jgi:shikimate kinase
MRNIYLIGMMGSGKSTIGALLAEQLGYHFIDTDAFIEKQEGKSVAEIFRDKGEAHFRKLEKALVDELPSGNAVIACGGGLPCYNNLLENIKQNGVVVYLKGNPIQLYKRLGQDATRPLLHDFKAYQTLLEARQSIYESADVVVNADEPVAAVLVDILFKTQGKVKEEG